MTQSRTRRECAVPRPIARPGASALLRVIAGAAALMIAACQPAAPPPARPAADNEPANSLPGPPPAAFQSDRIAVTATGEGPDVILIPGLGSSPRVWTDAVAAVPGYRYHLVQIKGFAGVPAEGNAQTSGAGDPGAAVRPVDSGLLSAWADEITRYSAAQDLNRPSLVGHSLGGALALRVATQTPEAVSKVMVVDMLPFLGTFYGGPMATSETVAPIAAGVRAAMLASPEDAHRASVEATIAGMINTESRRADAIADSLGSDRAVVAQAMYELIVLDQRAALSRFSGPLSVLYVLPKGLPITAEALDAGYEAAFAGAPMLSLKRVDDSAHFIMWDQPEAFHADLSEFLAIQ